LITVKQLSQGRFQVLTTTTFRRSGKKTTVEELASLLCLCAVKRLVLAKVPSTLAIVVRQLQLRRYVTTQIRPSALQPTTRMANVRLRCQFALTAKAYGVTNTVAIADLQLKLEKYVTAMKCASQQMTTMANARFRCQSVPTRTEARAKNTIAIVVRLLQQKKFVPQRSRFVLHQMTTMESARSSATTDCITLRTTRASTSTQSMNPVKFATRDATQSLGAIVSRSVQDLTSVL